MFMRTLDYS